ncbi:MAG: hypothetical protein GF308_11630 [Candidatus Heimdallarchaeota archaeon]|nr:hypothetical protein [Candidatus Heimdallarchaeota archaeon]
MSRLVPLEDFTRFPLQTASRWDHRKMDSETKEFFKYLKRNIWKHGIKKDRFPLCKEKGGKIRVIDGHLRIQALRSLYQEGKIKLPEKNGKGCLVEGKHFVLREMSDEEAEQYFIICMLQRKEPSISEWFELLDEFIGKRGFSKRGFAKHINKSHSLIVKYDKIRESEYRRAVEKGTMGIKEAYSLLKTPREEPEKEEAKADSTSNEKLEPGATVSTIGLESPTSQFDAWATDQEENPLTREEFEEQYPPSPAEQNRREAISLGKSDGGLSDQLFDGQEYSAELTTDQFRAFYYGDLKNKKLVEMHEQVSEERVIVLFKSAAGLYRCISFLLENKEKYPLTEEQLKRYISLKEKGSLTDRCPYFGSKMDAPSTHCSDCESPLHDLCTQQTREHIKNGNVPSNADKTLEELGKELAPYIFSSYTPQVNPDYWKDALLTFCKLAFSSKGYKKIGFDQLSKAINDELLDAYDEHLDYLRSHGPGSDLEQLDELINSIQSLKNLRKELLKIFKGTFERVRRPEFFPDKESSAELTFEDLLFFKPCKECVLSNGKNIWRWMGYNETTCSRHSVALKEEKPAVSGGTFEEKDIEAIRVKNRTSILKEQQQQLEEGG